MEALDQVRTLMEESEINLQNYIEDVQISKQKNKHKMTSRFVQLGADESDFNQFRVPSRTPSNQASANQKNSLLPIGEDL